MHRDLHHDGYALTSTKTHAKLELGSVMTSELHGAIEFDLCVQSLLTFVVTTSFALAATSRHIELTLMGNVSLSLH